MPVTDHEPGIAEPRRHRFGSGGKPLRQPSEKTRTTAAHASEPEHERRRHREPPRIDPPGHERAFGSERPRNAADPRRERPRGERQRNAERRRDRSARKLNQAESGQHPARPLPARRTQEAAHRVVLRRGRGRLPGIGHQHGCLGKRVGQPDPRRIGLLSRRRFNRQQRDVGQRGRRGMSVDAPRPEAATHWRAPSRGRAARASRALRASERFDLLERALQRHRPRPVRAVEHVPIDEGLQLRFGRFDGVAQDEQIAQAFPLLQAKIREARLRLVSRRQQTRCGRDGGHRSSGTGHPGEIRGGREFAAAAEPLAHERFRAARRGMAQSDGQHGIRQAAHRDDRFGEAPVAAGVVRGNAARTTGRRRATATTTSAVSATSGHAAMRSPRERLTSGSRARLWGTDDQPA